jgi:hypothetical protein
MPVRHQIGRTRPLIDALHHDPFLRYLEATPVDDGHA